MNPKKDLEGKTAIVTGSTEGIGFSIAEKLIERGANVLFVGLPFTPEKRREFHEKFNALCKQYPSQRFSICEADVTKDLDVRGMITQGATLGKGKIDILVNNAGIQIPRMVGVITPDEFRKVMDVNLNGAMLCTHYALPYMRGAKDAAIINMGSVHSHVASPGRAAYCASKFALDAYTRVAAVDLANVNVRVNMVSPAFVKTDLAMMQVKDRMKNYDETEEQAEAWRLQLQDGKWIEMDTLTTAVADIASGTAGLKTGESLKIDNGYVDRANAKGDGVAYFDQASRMAVEKMNSRIAERAATMAKAS